MRFRIMLIITPPGENARFGMESIHTYVSAADAQPDAAQLSEALGLPLYGALYTADRPAQHLVVAGIHEPQR